MYTIRKGLPADVPALEELWLRSVRATHHFLGEEDVAFYRPLVRQALEGLELHVAESGGLPAGFMLLNETMVEALFIDPAHMGKGLGTRFIGHAAEAIGGTMRVDVNEQNPDALAFYRAKGFEVIGRSECDAAGRPFPLLHLQRRADS